MGWGGVEEEEEEEEKGIQRCSVATSVCRVARSCGVTIRIRNID